MEMNATWLRDKYTVIKMIDISDLKLNDLWTKENVINTSLQDNNMDIFINFNIYNKPFITVKIYPQQHCTFDFSSKGLLSAKNFIKDILDWR